METEKDKIKPPFAIVIIDLIDAYHYADFFDEWRYSYLRSDYAPYADYEKVAALSDRLFRALNPTAKTQRNWTKWEAGYDVRVYDANFSCVYKAHEKLPRR